jgi:hypothetical protein
LWLIYRHWIIQDRVKVIWNSRTFKSQGHQQIKNKKCEHQRFWFICLKVWS